MDSIPEKSTIECPVCSKKVTQDDNVIYCENCGFNVPKKERHVEPKAA